MPNQVLQQALSDVKAGMPIEEFDKYYPELTSQKQTVMQYASDVKAGMPESEASKYYPELFGDSNQAKPIDHNSFWSSVGDAVADFGKGAIKGAGSTVVGMGKLGATAMNKLFGADDAQKNTAQVADNIKNQHLTPTNTAQKLGFGAEQIGEFFIPGGASSKLGKVAEGANIALKAGEEVPKLIKVAKTVANVGTKALAEGAIATGQTAMQQGKFDDNSTLNGIVATMFPVVGAGLSGVKKAVLKPVGEKIQESVIRATSKDLADGFNVENLTKYGVGGSLKDTVAKTHAKINSLVAELSSKLKESDNLVDLNKVYNDTVGEIINKSDKNFGDNESLLTVLGKMKNELELVAGNKAQVNLADATNIKRGAGTKGAWAFGRMEPDASATETAYSTFYNKLKTAIEENAPEGVKEINKQISDLIPISNAALRRLPIDQRNNIISLTDSIGLFSAIFDPKALALIGANKLSKSGKFGQFLVNVANREPKTAIGKRVFLTK